MSSRKSSAASVSKTRFHVLHGNFTGYADVHWDSPKFKITAIISSTFTDTHIERDIIINKILPWLRLLGRPYEIFFSFVDMRYGNAYYIFVITCIFELKLKHSDGA